MSKLKQRARQRKRQHPQPRVPGPRRPSVMAQGDTPIPEFGGFTSNQLATGGALLAQDLHNSALTAKAKATGGYPPASVAGHFLAPLARVYQYMDALSAACLAQAPPDMTAACAPGCYACCRLYVEVGPWEAFGIADYVTQACEAGAVPRDAVLARLHEEVARFATHGIDGPPRLCAFLSRDGSCGIYLARPSACRAYYSISREACEHFFGLPSLNDEPGPPVLRASDKGLAAQLTLAQTLVTENPPFPLGEIMPGYEMQSAVLRILETPNALVRYLHGEDIFAGCARLSPEADLRRAMEQLVQLRVPGSMN